MINLLLPFGEPVRFRWELLCRRLSGSFFLRKEYDCCRREQKRVMICFE